MSDSDEIIGPDDTPDLPRATEPDRSGGRHRPGTWRPRRPGLAWGLLTALVIVLVVGVWSGFHLSGNDSRDNLTDTAADRDNPVAGRDDVRDEPSSPPPSSSSPKPTPNDAETTEPEPEPTTQETVRPEPVAGCGDYAGNQAIACGLLGDHGFGVDQMSCLVPLWDHESGWNASAANPSSGAYGIPQALPGSKMAANGADWQTNPATQIDWGLDYIAGRYGDPCGAWGYWQSSGWY